MKEESELASRVEQLKVAAERRYRNLAEAIPDIVWTATTDGFLDYCNRRWEGYTGQTLDRARGLGWLSCVHEADLHSVRSAWRDAVEHGTPYTIECRLRRAADGAYRYHLCRAIPEVDGEGRVRAWLGTFTDCEALKRAVFARDEFMALASHELRTPLTALKLRLQSMQRGLVEGEPTHTKLDGALRQTSRLERLIENLLEVSRAEAGTLRLDVERFDLGETIREVVGQFGTEAERGNVVVELALPPDAEGQWDRVRIEQAMSNLLSNALRYRERGPVRISLTTEPSSVDISVEGGSPLAEANLARIFERFEQRGAPRAKGGLGVGLYVTRQIVQAHGGNIQAFCAHGALPVFKLSLPRFVEATERGGTPSAFTRSEAP